MSDQTLCPKCGAVCDPHVEEKLRLEGWLACRGCDFRRKDIHALSRNCAPKTVPEEPIKFKSRKR